MALLGVGVAVDSNFIIIFADNCDNIESLVREGALERIANKHVSLNIMPCHYPIVRECYLRALLEILGPEKATAEFLDAWRKRYDFLAEVFTVAETRIREDKRTVQG